MNFPANFTSNLYNFPLEKADKVQSYVDDLTKKIPMVENNEAYKLKQTSKLEIATQVNDLFKNKQIDCLILASKFRPLTILERIVGYLTLILFFICRFKK